jgi:hypothetical protein
MESGKEVNKYEMVNRENKEKDRGKRRKKWDKNLKELT